MKKLLIFFFMFFISYNAESQCYIDILKPTSDTTICEGDSVELNSEGSCTFLMNNNFNNGSIGSGWSSTAANPVFTNPCGPGPSGAHLWVGTTNSQERTLTTNAYDVSSTSCVIKWQMRYGAQTTNANCEDPDLTSEGVYLQYSINNGITWTDFPAPDLYPIGVNNPNFTGNTSISGSGGYWAPPSGGTHNGNYPPTQTVYYWHQYENNIPAAAATTSTQFRWAQLSTSNQGYDAWGIDEVEIYCPGQQNVSWSHGVKNFYGGWVSPNSTKTYTIYILDTTGNSASDNITINVIPTPDPNLNSDTTICNNPGDYATLEADSGFDTYQWNTGATSRTIQVDSSGNYKVTVTHGNCSGIDSVNVNVAPMPTVGIVGNKEICKGDSTTLTTPQVSGEYIWSTGDSTKDITISPEKDSTYYITVTSDLGCMNYDSVDIIVNPLPNVDIGGDGEICKGDEVILNASGGSVYEWSTGDITSIITISPKQTTSYNVKVTNNKGCTDSDTITVEVNDLPNVIATSDDSIICYSDETTLYAQGADVYEWNNNLTGDNISVGPTTTTNYIVVGSDINNCKNRDSVLLRVEDCSSLFMPNAFSPNGDGINDKIGPIGELESITSYKFIIWDRWGNIVFKTSDVNEKWDGVINGVMSPIGVYTYTIEYETIAGSEHDLSGTFHIIK